MVEYITKYDSPNFTPGAQSSLVFRSPRVVRGIVLHHWGDPSLNPTFTGVINWLCNRASGVSAHLVVEAGKAAWLVDAKDVAWASGDFANPRSIAIEANPRASDADYKAVAEVVADLRHHYGNISIYAHRHLMSTQCPGKWDINRVDAMAYTAERQKYGKSSAGLKPIWM